MRRGKPEYIGAAFGRLFHTSVTGRRKKRVYSLILLLGILFLCSPAWPQGPLRVAILPFQIHSAENLGYLKEGIYDIMSSRLTASGEIHTLGKSRIESVLIEMRPQQLTEEVAREAGKRLEADYVVLGSITKIGDFISLDARLIDTTGAKLPLGVFAQTRGLDQLMMKVDEFARDIGDRVLGKPAAVGERDRPESKTPYIVRPKKGTTIRGQETVGFQKSQRFAFEIKGLDIADVDGDGKNEIVIIDPHTIWVYEYADEKLRLQQKLQGRSDRNLLALDVADVNRNRTAEIFVTSVRGLTDVKEGDLNSFIVEHGENRFKMVSDKNSWYFAVLDLPGKGPTLVGQKMGASVSDTFWGSIYEFSWKGNSFRRGDKLKVPRKTALYGLAIADLTGDGREEIIRFDSFDRLRVLSRDGKDLLYKTSDKYGGSNTFFDRVAVSAGSSGGLGKRVYLPRRILVLDLDGDGRTEVIVNKNHFASGRFFERVRLADKAEIFDLVWDGMMLAEHWRTREIPGYIVDYQVEDFDNDGKRELVVAVVPHIDILQRSPYSHILFFELF
jgi:TolB-like protein